MSVEDYQRASKKILEIMISATSGVRLLVRHSDLGKQLAAARCACACITVEPAGALTSVLQSRPFRKPAPEHGRAA